MDRGNQRINGHKVDALQGKAAAGRPRRRQWSASEKARIVSESLVPGAKISQVARRYGMSIGLLSTWRRKAVAEREAANGDRMPAFVPVVLKDDGIHPSSVYGSAGIEIAVADAVIRLTGAVDGATLGAVISAVRGRA
jgi:transposase